jgi:hypothetical protein
MAEDFDAMEVYMPPVWCWMSNNAGITDIPSQDMKLDNVTKLHSTVFR